jgi:hypothetical protein
MFVELNFSCKFVAAAMLAPSDVLSRLLEKVLLIHDNTPPMPLYDAHLGGFFFYNTQVYGKKGLR